MNYKFFSLILVLSSFCFAAEKKSARKPNSQDNFQEFVETVFPKNSNLGKQISTNKSDLMVYEIIDIDLATENVKKLQGDKLKCEGKEMGKYDWAKDKKSISLKSNKATGSVTTFSYKVCEPYFTDAIAFLNPPGSKKWYLINDFAKTTGQINYYHSAGETKNLESFSIQGENTYDGGQTHPHILLFMLEFGVLKRVKLLDDNNYNEVL